MQKMPRLGQVGRCLGLEIGISPAPSVDRQTDSPAFVSANLVRSDANTSGRAPRARLLASNHPKPSPGSYGGTLQSPKHRKCAHKCNYDSKLLFRSAGDSFLEAFVSSLENLD